MAKGKLKESVVQWSYDMAAIKLYKQVCDDLKTADLDWVAKKARVSKGTMQRWLDGLTMLPHSSTLFRVAVALGFTINLTRTKAAAKTIPKRLKVVK